MSDILAHIARLIILSLAMATTPPPEHPHVRPSTFEGSLSRYNPGVMEDVLAWRHENGIPAGFNPWPVGGRPYDGFIAVIGCENVGKTALLWLTIDGVTLPDPKRVYIADCTSPGRPAAQWMVDHQIAAEVDYEAWNEWGIVDGRGAWVEVEIGE